MKRQNHMDKTNPDGYGHYRVLRTFNKLTDGEAVHLYRRSLGHTQSELADMYNLWGKAIISNMEWDVEIGDPDLVQDALLYVSQGLASREYCIIARRRSYQTIKDAASRMGVSPQTLRHWERGHLGSKKLVAYWRALKFVIPPV